MESSPFNPHIILDDLKAGFLVHNGLFLVLRAMNLLSFESIVTAIWVSELNATNTSLLSISEAVSTIFLFAFLGHVARSNIITRDAKVVAREELKFGFRLMAVLLGFTWFLKQIAFISNLVLLISILEVQSIFMIFSAFFAPSTIHTAFQFYRVSLNRNVTEIRTRSKLSLVRGGIM